eukprot:9492742-Pyramimonas_sp.AAC.1
MSTGVSPLGSLKGLSWAVLPLGPSWCSRVSSSGLRASWAVLGRCVGPLGPLWTLSGTILASWGALGAHLGACLRRPRGL